MDYEVYGPLDYQSLSENQKRLVAILPIPSAILSLIGSSLIVFMAMRKRRDTSKKWTPYNRLIMGMSFFDILTSITLTFASFLYPKETSGKAWAIGNDTSCSIVGALNQLIYGVILYYGCLSVYFLLTARFGFTNSQISHRIEPFMHVFCFGYPLITSFVGLFMGAYAEPEIGIGCWVKRWPKQCISYREPVGSEEACQSELVGWILGGWVGSLTFATAFISMVVLFVHARRKEKELIKASTSPCDDENRSSVFKTEMMSCEASMNNSKSMRTNQDVSETTDARGDTLVSSMRSVSSDQLDERMMQLRQLKRLKLVRSQAFLYFLSYFLTNGWSQVTRLIEADASSAVEEKELPYDFYGVLLCQCILYPLQGFTNLIVFVRPKWLKLRAENPNEPKWWVLKMIIFEVDDHPLERTPTSTRRLVDDEMRKHMASEDDTQNAVSVEGNESIAQTRKASLDNTASTAPYQSPVQCEPVKKVSIPTGGSASVAFVSTMASGDEEQMKEVMERTKRRLEKYKADRMTNTGSSTSLKASAELTEASNSPNMMSPIQKIRGKMKVQGPAIPDIFGDDDSDCPPLPIPETVERSTSSSHKGKGPMGSSAVRMDGSIVHGDSSEFDIEDD